MNLVSNSVSYRTQMVKNRTFEAYLSRRIGKSVGSCQKFCFSKIRETWLPDGAPIRLNLLCIIPADLK